MIFSNSQDMDKMIPRCQKSYIFVFLMSAILIFYGKICTHPMKGFFLFGISIFFWMKHWQFAILLTEKLVIILFYSLLAEQRLLSLQTWRNDVQSLLTLLCISIIPSFSSGSLFLFTLKILLCSWQGCLP